jgi:8-oxo-dGTP diphosphatase
MRRRSGWDAVTGARGEPVPVVSALLVNPAGEVLLQLRDDDPALLYPDCWTIPGGHVEPGETPAEAIRRELREEMALDVPLVHWKTVDAPRADYVVRQYFFTGPLEVDAADLPLYEGQAVRFAGPADLADMRLAFGFGETLRRFFADRSRS